MPYVSKAEKEAARWISEAEAVEHIREIEECDETEARRQLSNAINEHPEMVRWIFPPRGSGRLPFRVDAPPRTIRLLLKDTVHALWRKRGESAASNNDQRIEPAASENVAQGATRKSTSGKASQRKPREHPVETNAKLESKIRAVLSAAKKRWPDKAKRVYRPMALELAKPENKLGFTFETIRQILRGTYRVSRRLKIPGLHG